MRPSPSQGPIRPKVSTMPRAKTEAAAYLDVYKLVNEKKRLQQELGRIEDQRSRIQKRLVDLTYQIQDLEETAHQLRDREEMQMGQVRAVGSEAVDASEHTGAHQTLFLEY